MATPDIVWSALKLTVAIACISAKNAPEIPPTINESHGFPVNAPQAAPEKAPIVIIPSITYIYNTKVF